MQSRTHKGGHFSSGGQGPPSDGHFTQPSKDVEDRQGMLFRTPSVFPRNETANSVSTDRSDIQADTAKPPTHPQLYNFHVKSATSRPFLKKEEKKSRFRLSSIFQLLSRKTDDLEESTDDLGSTGPSSPVQDKFDHLHGRHASSIASQFRQFFTSSSILKGKDNHSTDDLIKSMCATNVGVPSLKKDKENASLSSSPPKHLSTTPPALCFPSAITLWSPPDSWAVADPRLEEKSRKSISARILDPDYLKSLKGQLFEEDSSFETSFSSPTLIPPSVISLPLVTDACYKQASTTSTSFLPLFREEKPVVSGTSASWWIRIWSISKRASSFSSPSSNGLLPLVTFINVACPAIDITTRELIKLISENGGIEKDKEDLFLLGRPPSHKICAIQKGMAWILNPQDKPLLLQKKWLEQVGYNEFDNLSAIEKEEDHSHIFKFIFIPLGDAISVLGRLQSPTTQHQRFPSSGEVAHFCNRNLIVIPTHLFRVAASLVYVDFSKNPMLKLPTDFIQACSSLNTVLMNSCELEAIPHALSFCTTLTTLCLSDNLLREDALEPLCLLKNLEKLDLSANQISYLPLSMVSLGRLCILNLASNALTTLPSAILRMTGLIRLDVSFNFLTCIPDGISTMINLVQLDCSFNRIKILTSNLSTMPSLALVDLRGNAIQDLSSLSTSSTLKVLLLSFNSIPKITNFSNFPRLSHINMDHNSLTHLQMMTSISKHTRPHEHFDRPLNDDNNTIRDGKDFIEDCDKVYKNESAITDAPYPSYYSCLAVLSVRGNKLVSIPDELFDWCPNLKKLYLDNNQIKSIPLTIDKISPSLKVLTVSRNKLCTLPDSIGSLAKLTILDVHENNISALPLSIYNCSSLSTLNVSSNLLPSLPSLKMTTKNKEEPVPGKEEENGEYGTSPILHSPFDSLTCLLLADNRLDDECLDIIQNFHRLSTLNLSYNRLANVQSLSLLSALTVLHLSGNEITTIPDLPLAIHTLYINNNCLKSIPGELGKLSRLSILDVSINNLRYNIANWPYDWHWYWNQNLYYLNMSGNGRFEIYQAFETAATTTTTTAAANPSKRHPSFNGRPLEGGEFGDSLRILDVSRTKSVSVALPRESLKVRVRSSNISSTSPPVSSSSSSALPLLAPCRSSRASKSSLSQYFSMLNPVSSTRVKPSFDNSVPSESMTPLSGDSGLTAMATSVANNSNSANNKINAKGNKAAGNVASSSAGKATYLPRAYLSYGVSEHVPSKDQYHICDLFERDTTLPGVIMGLFEGYDIGGNDEGESAHLICKSFLSVYGSERRRRRSQQVDRHDDQHYDVNALRRTFLSLDGHLYSLGLGGTGSGCMAVVAHWIPLSKQKNGPAEKSYSPMSTTNSDRLLVANVGGCMGVLSRAGHALVLSKRHTPHSRSERARVRSSAGFIKKICRTKRCRCNLQHKKNKENFQSERAGHFQRLQTSECEDHMYDKFVESVPMIDGVSPYSRSFGWHESRPSIIAEPSIHVVNSSPLDEFLILGNSHFWEWMDPQTAVDISSHTIQTINTDMAASIAAQELRDMAVAFGATKSISVQVLVIQKGPQKIYSAELSERSKYKKILSKSGASGSSHFPSPMLIADSTIARLKHEISPPIGDVSLVFTDIRNSTLLWEILPTAMESAIKVHHDVLRRLLRSFGGYEVKTEGDAFMAAFPTPIDALRWCLYGQVQLLEADWPQEILQSPEGQPISGGPHLSKPHIKHASKDREDSRDNNSSDTQMDDLYDAHCNRTSSLKIRKKEHVQRRCSLMSGGLLYRGLSVRMGIHVGTPICELDPITRRMDYFGAMVNRAARICGSAQGGQICVSEDVYRRIKKTSLDSHVRDSNQRDDLYGESSSQGKKDALYEKEDVFGAKRDSCANEGYSREVQGHFRRVEEIYGPRDNFYGKDFCGKGVFLGKGNPFHGGDAVLDAVFVDLGPVRLRGLESRENLYAVYPSALKDRFHNEKRLSEMSISMEQMRDIHNIGRRLDAVVRFLGE